MKTLSLLLAGLGLLGCSAPSKAQDEQKLRNDPTYSTHNYKQPNKAATARQWEAKTGVTVQQPAPAAARLANYKNPVPGQSPVGGVTVPHTPDENLANRNYKMQRPSVGTGQDSTLARKRAKQREGTANGN